MDEAKGAPKPDVAVGFRPLREIGGIARWRYFTLKVDHRVFAAVCAIVCAITAFMR